MLRKPFMETQGGAKSEYLENLTRQNKIRTEKKKAAQKEKRKKQMRNRKQKGGKKGRRRRESRKIDDVWCKHIQPKGGPRKVNIEKVSQEKKGKGEREQGRGDMIKTPKTKRGRNENKVKSSRKV